MRRERAWWGKAQLALRMHAADWMHAADFRSASAP